MANEQTTVVRQTEGAGTVGTAGVGTAQATTVVSMPIWLMILVRVARMYFQVVVGVLTADGFGVIELSSTHDLWSHIYHAAIVGLAPAVISLLQNVLEFLTKLDVKYPQLRA